MMTSLAGTLATTLTITVRKFVSLIISVLWFGSYFSWMHWLSIVLVFGGSTIFSVVKDEGVQEKSDTKKKSE
jgi:UDP-xylose/UDP-N-acetylglucosamine transporter B4